jgi:acetyl-CoA carboxylase carboxyl transferase subunit alpha
MKITARDLAEMGLVDEIVPEPPGGAQANHEAVFRSLDEVLWRQLQELGRVPPEKLPEERYRKFRNMGRLGREFREETS